MIHGGDLVSYEDYYHGKLVDFSSNINPLGYPRGLEEVLEAAFSSLLSYPDIKYRRLKSSVAGYLGCPEENLLLGNGSVELIDVFISRAARVVLFTPSFVEYEIRAKVHAKELVFLDYGEDFSLEIEGLGELLREGDLLVLGNPNNPTGLRIEEKLLLEIYRHVREKKALLLLDEAFYEFCPRDYDSLELFKEEDYRGLGILRAATKFFALPGLRLGYGVSSLDQVEKINKTLLPWNINSLAEAAGNHIFRDRTYIESSQAYIEAERSFLEENLARLRSIRVFPSQSNFILIKLHGMDEDRAFKFFLERGLLIRKCSNFRGLDRSYIRVAVKDRENNTRLLDVFRELEDLQRKSPV